MMNKPLKSRINAYMQYIFKMSTEDDFMPVGTAFNLFQSTIEPIVEVRLFPFTWLC